MFKERGLQQSPYIWSYTQHKTKHPKYANICNAFHMFVGCCFVEVRHEIYNIKKYM